LIADVYLQATISAVGLLARRPLLVAGLGTDLGTEHSETDANKRDGVKQAGRLNAADMEI
jgi:hypothetical protein